MTRSERVNLIQKLVAALCHEQPEIVELTLSEFDIPREQRGDYTRDGYLINRLQHGKDDKLQELAAHLSLPSPSLPIDLEAERRLWMAGYCRCFLSHTSKHKTEAASLKVELEAYGCDVFVAHEDIEPTLEWVPELENALASCHCLLALVTDDFHASLWTDQEVGFVLGRGLPVVPIQAPDNPYGLMGKLQAFRFDEATLSDVAETVFTALSSKDQTGQLVASAAVQAFLDSPDSAAAAKRMGILERLPAITPELLRRLSDAAPTNSHIAGSPGVPERLDDLLLPF